MNARITTALHAAAPDLAKGVRAAVVMLVPFYLARSLARPELAWTALGGWLGTLADPGGSRLTRAKVLAAYGAAGAVVVAVAEAIAARPAMAVAGLTLATFVFAMLRAASGAAGSVGTLLTVTAAVASARARTTPVHDALFFALGAASATVLSSVLWPVWTHLPVRRAVAAVYGALAAYLDDVEAAIASGARRGDARWNALMRDHHRRIRDAIEAARAIALAVRARRMGETRYGSNVRAILGAGEAQFPLLATLVQEVEALAPDARRAHAASLRAIAANDRDVERALVAAAIRSRAPAPPRASLAPAPSGAPTCAALAARLDAMSADAAERAHAIDEPVLDEPPPLSAPPRAPTAAPRPASRALRDFARAVEDALAPRSVYLQHAVRAALAAFVASIAGAIVSPDRAYWVTLTALAILQPYTGATMKRASERVVGTVLGCVAALVITRAVHAPLVLSALLFPLSIAAVATRPRSYRLFTFFLTPVFVLLAERHAQDWGTAVLRAGDSIVGGLIALVIGVLVFPASEKERVPDAMGDMLDAVETYAAAVLEARDAKAIAGARRAAGIAFGAAETTLERYLAEPRRDEARAAEAMLLVTYVRRLGTALTSIDTLATEARAAAPGADRAATAAYVRDVLEAARARVRDGAAARTREPPSLTKDAPLVAALERAVGWATLVAGVAGRE